MSTVRRLAPEEAALYRAIRLEALRTAPDAYASTYEREVEFDDAFLTERLRNSPVWAAFDDEHAIGMAGFFRQTGTKNAHKGVLWGMYVAPSFRGRGIAATLTEAVIAHASTEVEFLQLSCISTNEGARRLYERHGFVVYGTERNALKVGDTYHDELLMALALPISADAPNHSRRTR